MEEEEEVIEVDEPTEIVEMTDDQYMDFVLGVLNDTSRNVIHSEQQAIAAWLAAHEPEMALPPFVDIPELSVRTPGPAPHVDVDIADILSLEVPRPPTGKLTLLLPENFEGFHKVKKSAPQVLTDAPDLLSPSVRGRTEEETSATQSEIREIYGERVPQPDGSVMLALYEGQAEARYFLTGDSGTEPVFTRHWHAPAAGGAFGRVMYRLPGKAYNPSVDDRHNAAIVIERLSFHNMMVLLLEMYRIEAAKLFPGTDRPVNIVSVFCNYQNDAGRIGRKAVYFPAHFFTGPIEDFGKTIVKLSANALQQLMDLATRETQGGYDYVFKYGEHIDRIYPNQFGVVIRNPAYYPTRTPVRGLTRQQLLKIQSLKNIAGMTVENLDKRNCGYCLFDTVAALAHVSVEDLIKECGSPKPSNVFVEDYADRIANFTNMNLRFFKVLSGGRPEEFFRTTTSYYRTETFLISLIHDRGNRDKEFETYRHIFHIVKDENVIGPETLLPFSMPTVFVNTDLESVGSKDYLNEAWAVNLFPYRLPAPLETGVVYDLRAKRSGFQCYSMEKQMWLRVIETVDTNGNLIDPVTWNTMLTKARSDKDEKEEKRLLDLNPTDRICDHVKDCVTVYRDGSLNVLNKLIPYVMDLRRSLPEEKVNIVLTGFNSSRFDNFLELRYWLEKCGFKLIELNPGIYGNSILTFRLQIDDPWTAITTWDLRRHVVGSLRSCCDLWLVPSGGAKGDLDHRLIQTIYNIHPEKFGEFLDANWEDAKFTVGGATVVYPGIRTYCSQDVIACSTLHYMYKTAIEFITNLFFIEKYGASLAMICTLTPPRKRRWKREGDQEEQESEEAVARNNADRRGLWLRDHLPDVSVKTRELVAVAKRTSQGNSRAVLPINLEHVNVKVNVSEDVERTYQEATRVPHPEQVLTKSVWDSMGGLVHRSDNLNPNIESYPTLSGFATMLFKTLCETNGWRQVQGFRYETTKILRDHMCIAGRSQGDFGFHEEEPIGTVDKVSLYPTAMTNGRSKFALGHCDPSKPKSRSVCCDFVTGPPVYSESMPVGIWKVRIRSQPNGVVVPPKSEAGYHWETNLSTAGFPDGHALKKGFSRLVTTSDLRSLKLVGADFDVVEGIIFTENTPDLYKEYMLIAMREKNRQDQLKAGDPTVKLLYPGEKYNAGIREACKLILNILSGKEITKPYLSKREVYDSEVIPAQMDLSNCVKQYEYALKARKAITKEIPDLAKWRSNISKIRQIARLNGDLETLGKNYWIGEWKGIPKAGQYSHINGYHIYGEARYSMNLCYRAVGFDRFFMTETDSMAIRISDVKKLYGEKSDFGDPLLYLEEERRLGLFRDAEPCVKPKQFGQLEFESTPLMQKAAAKKLGYLRKPKSTDIHHPRELGKPEKMVGNEDKIIEMHYREHKPSDEEGLDPKERWRLPRNELIVSIGSYNRKERVAKVERADVPTGLFGPFIAIGGKKIYAIYFLDESRKPWFLKCKFKGATFYHDWVIDFYRDEQGEIIPNVKPPLFSLLKTLTRKERIDYALANLGDFRRADVHRMRKRDIFEYIRHKYLYLIQSRVSENSTKLMQSKQNVILKTLSPTSPKPTAKQLVRIKMRSDEVEEINLRKMARSIRGVDKDDDNLCECCEEAVSIVIDTKGYCALHGSDKPPRATELCLHKDKDNHLDCGCLRYLRSDFCQMHSGLDQPVYCAHPNCNEKADPMEVMKGYVACNRHGDCKTIQALPCLFTSKREATTCGQPVSRNAVKAGYQLCYSHYSNNNKEAKRSRISPYRLGERDRTAAMNMPHAVPNRDGCLPACTFMTKKGQCLKPVNGDAKLCPMHESLTRNREARKEKLSRPK